MKYRNKKTLFLYSLLVLTLVLFNFVFISLAIGAEEGAEHPSLFKDYLWKIINFGILFFILYKFAKKPLQSFFKQRSETIEKTLNEAREAKELAQKALQAVQEKLKTKDEDIEKILAASKRVGEEEREILIKQADKLKERILEQAKANIEYELRHAKEAIKAEAVEIAMEIAEKKIKEKLTKEDQEKLLEDSLTKIGGKG